IISFDSENPKEKFNGSTWLRRLLENQSKKVLLIGLRSFDEDEIKFLKERKVKFFTSMEILKNKDKVLKSVRDFTKNSNLHISLDFDFFDPSVFPAVDYPEPGGIYFYDFADIVENIEGKIVSIDACCLKPIENNLISEFLAVKSMFYLLSKI
ncbi:MAG: arginase family protein, partial [Candidatus Aenigmatarchaeota archaeon]